MSPRALASGLVLAALVVLTGCSAFGVGGPSAAERTVTPAPVPTAEPSLPPGVTTDGVDDHRRLGVAHEQQLTNRSYTVRIIRSVRLDNGTTVRRLERGRAVGADGRMLSWVYDRRTEQADRPDDAIVTRRVWTNDTVRVLRYEYANGTARYTVTAPRQRTPYRDTGYTVGRMLAEEDAAVVARDADGSQTTYSLRARNLTGSLSSNAALDTVTTSSIRAVITRDGLVRDAVVRYTGRRDGTRAVASSTISYDTDTGAVTRPDWVDTALERARHDTAENTERAGGTANTTSETATE